MQLLYNAAALPWSFGQVAYWELRVRGVTDADIRGSVVLGCCAAALIVWPATRDNSSNWAVVFFLLDRWIIWLFRQWWFAVMRKGLLLTTALGSAILLLLTPSTRSQEDPFSLPRVVARHDSEIAALKESVQEIKSDVKAMRKDQDDFYWWWKGVGVAALTTLVGLNVTRYWNDARRGKAERERDERDERAERETHRFLKRRQEDEDVEDIPG